MASHCITTSCVYNNEIFRTYEIPLLDFIAVTAPFSCHSLLFGSQQDLPT